MPSAGLLLLHWIWKTRKRNKKLLTFLLEPRIGNMKNLKMQNWLQQFCSLWFTFFFSWVKCVHVSIWQKLVTHHSSSTTFYSTCTVWGLDGASHWGTFLAPASRHYPVRVVNLNVSSQRGYYLTEAKRIYAFPTAQANTDGHCCTAIKWWWGVNPV